jgi:hypothetical protein
MNQQFSRGGGDKRIRAKGDQEKTSAMVWRVNRSTWEERTLTSFVVAAETGIDLHVIPRMGET